MKTIDAPLSVYGGTKILTLAIIVGISLLGSVLTHFVVRPANFRLNEKQRIPPPLPPSAISFNNKSYQLDNLVNPLKADGDNLVRNLDAGAVIYFQNCVFCHGAQLNGNGQYAKGLTPRPANFLLPETQKRMSDSYLFWRILTGGPGLPEDAAPWDSAMPVWHTRLKEKEVWQLILFLTDKTRAKNANSQLLSSEPQPVLTKEKRGLINYRKWCQGCHGEKGEGNGPAAKLLNPPPRDFTTGVYKYVSSLSDGMYLASDEDLFQTISMGLVGTAMPAWKEILSKKERWEMVATLKRFTDLYEDTPPPEKISFANRVPYSPKSVAEGKKIYFEKAKCFECHGEEGRGNGLKKLKEDRGARVYPRNQTKPWTFRGGSKIEDIYTRITVGIPGTPMPSFSKALTAEERWHTANYVSSLKDDTYRIRENKNIIEAKYLTGKLPQKIQDPAWESCPSTPFLLVPNLIAPKRLFTPTVDGLKIKALYNETEIEFLLEWADRTKSNPGDQTIAEISEKDFFEDAVAIQFPDKSYSPPQRPYFGHGERENGVNIWYWNSGSLYTSQKATEFKANGLGTHKSRPEKSKRIKAKGIYHEGVWQVMFRRPLKTKNGDSVQLETGSYIPVAFANWDGSNGEKGSRHTLTSWQWLHIPLTKGSMSVTYPIVAFCLLMVAQLLCLGLFKINIQPQRH